MTSQEQRNKWQLIRQANYAGRLEACRRCGSAPQLYVIDPVGLWLKNVLQGETFFAARCACGSTGSCRNTGKTALGQRIDEQRAAALAAEAWNTEQQAEQATPLPVQTHA